MDTRDARRFDAWTALAAEPAVRAAERAIVTGSAVVLADTLSVATASESRRRLAHVLELKRRADADPEKRGAYQQAAGDLRSWAAGVYLAALREPREPVRNPYTEESISLRRSGPRPRFPGQRKRHPFDAGAPAEPRMGSTPDGAPPAGPQR